VVAADRHEEVEMTSIVPPGGDRDVQPTSAPGRRVQPNNVFVPFDKAEIEQSIPARFAAQVRRHADRLAVKTRYEALTYAQLDATTDRVAAAILAARGHGEEPVGFLFERGASLVVATLATLKAGKVGVPMDPAIPPARAHALLKDAQAGFVLTDRRTCARARELTEGICPLLDIEAIDPSPTRGSLPVSLSPDSLACIVYTSGSTGQPKGVMHTHRNLLHQTMVHSNQYRIAAEDRLAFVASPATAYMTWCILPAVLNGASLFPLDPQRESAIDLFHWVVQEGITVLLGGRTIIRALDGAPGQEAPRFSALRLASFGGEAVYRRDVEACRRLFPGAFVSIGLGATETGAMARYFLDENTPIAGHVLPVGYPAEDKEILLLDEDGAEVAADAVGEIAVRSRYLAPGYWRRPDLTAAAFRPDPAGGPERIYRTGDLGRRLPDGCLIHCGRKDFQVKIRGFRVEVAEVEGALLSLPKVQEAVVVVREDRPGDRRLVAYLVPTARPAPTVTVLRKALADALPDYMVPAAFVVLDALPKTPGGKVDRRALPAPGRARPALDQPLVAPRTPVEAAVGAIWAEVLGLDEVGMHDNFFDLGGHSLAASQVLARVSETFHVALPVRTLFEAPTVTGLALAVVQGLMQNVGADEIARLLPTPPERSA
jgi:amino acid adenylation domain-containing protein